MKNIFTCILVFLVLFAYNYETIKCLSKIIGAASITWNNDFQGEEKSSELEEERTEKNKEVNLFDDLYYSNHHFASHFSCSDFKRIGRLSSKQNSDFSSSDYSQVVYSPPDIL